MEALNPFSEYLLELSYYLPRRTRGEILRELASGLQAELDGERARRPAVSTETLMEEILRRHDTPLELAKRFPGRRQALIGPDVYATYKLALSLSLGATLIANGALALASGLGWATLENLVVSLVMVFAAVTVWFATLDYIRLPGRAALGRTLPPLHGLARSVAIDERVSRAAPGVHHLLRIAALALMLALLVFAPRLIGILLVGRDSAGGWHATIYPILSEWFLGWPHLLIAAWCGAAVFAGALRMAGSGGKAQRWLEVLIPVLGILVGSGILLSGAVFAIPPGNTAITAVGELLKRQPTRNLLLELPQVLTVIAWAALILRALVLGINIWNVRKVQRFSCEFRDVPAR